MTNANDTNGKKSVFGSLFSGSGLATILVALITQAIVSVVYQITNNEQQAARIEAAQAEIKQLTNSIDGMRTPLSVRVFKIEDRFEEFVRRVDDLNRRMEAIDTVGTRSLALVASNQQRVMSQIDRMGERMLMTDKKFADMDIAGALFKAQVDAAISSIKRIDERLDRIVQALDALSSRKR